MSSSEVPPSHALNHIKSWDDWKSNWYSLGLVTLALFAVFHFQLAMLFTRNITYNNFGKLKTVLRHKVNYPLKSTEFSAIIISNNVLHIKKKIF